MSVHLLQKFWDLLPLVRCFDAVLETEIHLNPVFLCTDINRFAANATRATGKQNQVCSILLDMRTISHSAPRRQVPLEPILASLSSPLSSRLRNAVDILLFNPPYVPTIPDEADDAQIGAGIQGSWAGGNDGMQITDTFLQMVEVSPGLFVQVRADGRFMFTAIVNN